MATYKGIKGVKVVTKATDPTASEAAGTVWYNSTSPTALKYSIESAAAWAAGGAINTGRGLMCCTGTVTAAIIAGGEPNTVNSETYNGSTWTEVSNLNTGVANNIGFGTSTAAVNCVGILAPGTNTDITEIWDGSSWTTSPATLNTARSKVSAANQGTTTAGLIFAGSPPPGSSNNTDLTESFDGSTWAETADLSTARRGAAGAGTQAAALCCTGFCDTPSPNTFVAVTEQWDGTSWSNVNDVNTARQTAGSAGTVTSALIYGGNPGQQAVTEQWNGTGWTEVADLATGREGLGKGTGASGTSALAVGKDGSPNTLTEVWSDPVYTIKTVTVS